ncbi:neocarzinostatin apoprotein domain-containing protein [Streptomyces sp. NBC_00638]|uniref:neocarzinostatin apoprotein domain-containing protein n=1 Tax=unclassified Streptomyces TaxID=2593676 RepID=UPI00224FC2EA|nr:neocarzinostatin apoprotein domain-containing protein [Streptomyces sp. NBC_00638]MCX5009047.1 neocarzinostatin apoprotein domain-containing protein [Streptomyces sp. NBC_00638]
MNRVLSRTGTGAAALAAVVAVCSAATPAAAAATLTVSKTTGLAPGDTVTVSAKGLSPSQAFVPLGLCKPDPTGPTDCDTATALIGKTDSSGVWHLSSSNATSARLKILAKAGGADCTSKAGACVVAVFISASNELAQVPLTVSASGSGSPSPSTSASPSASGSASTSGGSTSGSSGSTSGDSGSASGSTESLPQTGSVDGVAVALLAGGTLLMGGASFLLLIRRRRDGAA